MAHAGGEDENDQRTPDVLRRDPQIAVAQPEPAEDDDRDQQQDGDAADDVERPCPPHQGARRGERLATHGAAGVVADAVIAPP